MKYQKKIINANNDIVHQIPLDFIGLIASKPLLKLRKRFTEETVYEYERNMIAYVQQNYNLTFKNLDEIKQYNRDIA